MLLHESSAHRVFGRLQIRLHNTPTQLDIIDQNPPLRIVRPFPLADGGLLIHLHNVSGAILGGDHLDIAVDLEENCIAQLTTPSATCVYRHRPGFPTAIQRVTLNIGRNALLEYLPDPLIPFAHARFKQETTIDIAEKGGLFWWEILAPGRSARNEQFAYESLQSSVIIRAQNRPIAIERTLIQPAQGNPSARIRLGQYPYLTNFYICHVGRPPTFWQQLAQELHNQIESIHPANTIWGVTPLVADGIVVRGLSQESHAMAQTLHAIWEVAKQAIYHRSAEPPRKQY